jgi:hypothetical protein
VVIFKKSRTTTFVPKTILIDIHSQVISIDTGGGKYGSFVFAVVNNNVMEMYRGVKVYLHAFIYSKLDRGFCLMHTHSFYSLGKSPWSLLDRKYDRLLVR